MQDFDPNKKTKSFWKRPEGVTGAVFLAGIGVAGIVLLDKILPWLIKLMQNTLHAGLLLATIGAITFVLLDVRFRNFVSYAYKSVMRKLTGMLIELDPINILRIHIDEMKKNRSNMNAQIENLRGQLRRLQNIISQNKEDHENNLKLAQRAQKEGKQHVVTLQTRKAGRLQQSNITLNNLYVKMELLYRMLGKMFETAGILIEDTEDEVNVKERERNAILSGHSALRSAMAIISGDPDKKAMFDQAMEFMVEDIGQKAGEIERMMEVSATFLDSIDLQNGVYEEDGLKMLEQWEKESVDTLLLGNDVKLITAQAQDNNQVLDLDAPISEVVASSRGNKYLNSLK